ncbi:hypothetical protein F4859DRAFT_520009 [Xylaria cf. heliscus]|nr:hypothetical protein F4859DRAFT_520009 [Xylaria cf. heliscus]
MPPESASRFLSDSILLESSRKMYELTDYANHSTAEEIRIVGRKYRQIKLRRVQLDLDDLEIRITKPVPDYFFNLENAFSESEIKMVMPNALITPHVILESMMALVKLAPTTRAKLDYKKLEKIDGWVTKLRGHNLGQRGMKRVEMMIMCIVHGLAKLDSIY